MAFFQDSMTPQGGDQTTDPIMQLLQAIFAGGTGNLTKPIDKPVQPAASNRTSVLPAITIPGGGGGGSKSSKKDDTNKTGAIIGTIIGSIFGGPTGGAIGGQIGGSF